MNSLKTTIATASGAFGSVYQLVHGTAGTELAGSGTRETGEYVEVTA